MSSEKSPAFRFYPDDFIAGCQGMSAEEVGVYIRLLCLQWTKGYVPNDPEIWLRYGGAKATPWVMSKFEKTGRGGNELKNKRMEEERAKQEEYRLTRSNAGRKGAAKLWSSHGEVKAKDGIPLPLPLPPSATSKEVAAGASAPTAVKSKRLPLKLPDDEWLDGLKSVAAYSHIDIRREFSKAEAWISAKPGRKLTRPFFINWLNRIEPPVKPVNGAKFNPWQKEEERGLICH